MKLLIAVAGCHQTHPPGRLSERPQSAGAARSQTEPALRPVLPCQGSWASPGLHRALAGSSVSWHPRHSEPATSSSGTNTLPKSGTPAASVLVPFNAICLRSCWSVDRDEVGRRAAAGHMNTSIDSSLPTQEAVTANLNSRLNNVEVFCSKSRYPGCSDRRQQ